MSEFSQISQTKMYKSEYEKNCIAFDFCKGKYMRIGNKGLIYYNRLLSSKPKSTSFVIGVDMI